MFEILKKTHLFNGVSTNEVENICSRTLYNIRNFSKNDIVAISGDVVLGQYIVLSGSVRGEMTDDDGKTLKIEDIPVSRLLAPAFLFGQNSCYPVNIICNEDNTKLIFFPRESIVDIMQSNKRILLNYLNAMSNRTQFLSHRIKLLSFQTIKGKIAHYLLSNTDSNELLLNLSQEKLSELFAVTRPSLSRALKEMNDQKIIDQKGRKIKILDAIKLKMLIK